jgi:hypothetical protein
VVSTVQALTELDLGLDSPASFDFSNAPNLTSLTMAHRDAGLGFLATSFPSLRELTVAVQWDASGRLKPLLELKQLASVSLTLSTARASANAMWALAHQLTKVGRLLTAVSLRGNAGAGQDPQASDQVLVALGSDCPKLTTLSLAHWPFSLKGAKGLAQSRCSRTS